MLNVRCSFTLRARDDLIKSMLLWLKSQKWHSIEDKIHMKHFNVHNSVNLWAVCFKLWYNIFILLAPPPKKKRRSEWGIGQGHWSVFMQSSELWFHSLGQKARSHSRTDAVCMEASAVGSGRHREAQVEISHVCNLWPWYSIDETWRQTKMRVRG